MLFLLNSCKYPCDGFPSEKLIWIPYEMGEMLRYSNGTDTIEFEVIDDFKTEPDYFRGLVMDYECFFEGYYVTNKSDKGYCLKERLSNDGNKEMSVKITENDVFNFSLFEQNIRNDSLKIAFMTKIEILGSVYYSAYKITKDDPGQITWIIKAKDKGIVQFYDNVFGEIWTLIE